MSKSIAAEEEWFRLLVLELTPVLEIMRENDLPAGKTSTVDRETIHGLIRDLGSTE